MPTFIEEEGDRWWQIDHFPFTSPISVWIWQCLAVHCFRNKACVWCNRNKWVFFSWACSCSPWLSTLGQWEAAHKKPGGMQIASAFDITHQLRWEAAWITFKIFRQCNPRRGHGAAVNWVSSETFSPAWLGIGNFNGNKPAAWTEWESLAFWGYFLLVFECILEGMKEMPAFGSRAWEVYTQTCLFIACMFHVLTFNEVNQS